MRRFPAILALLVLLLGIAAVPHRLISRPDVAPDFVHFESSHVHPAALTPNGDLLLVVNTPDARLSVFDLTGEAPVRIAEIPVGLEPVSVAARNDHEAWVVNRLSDDVSVVDLDQRHVRATVQVGDEPCDVVFAGPAGDAFVSVSEEDAVKVFDPSHLDEAPFVIAIPGRRPRALARSREGSQVLVDVFSSSGAMTVLSAKEVAEAFPTPLAPEGGLLPPEVGVIVQKNAQGDWLDALGRNWNAKIPYDVPAVELVYLHAASRSVQSTRGGMATVVMGLAVDPVTGAAAVSGMEAMLGRRFEPNQRGRFTQQKLAIVPDRTASPTQVQLNPHVDYDVSPGPAAEHDSALGMPTGVCWSPDGQRVYVTSLASDKLGVVDRGGAIVARVPTVAGPTGVVADPRRGRVYVVGRHRNQLQTLSSATLASVAVASIGFDPTPDPIVNGRKFFYGGFTSGHGEQSCASCHLFGDTDHLVWDLGDPNGQIIPPPPGNSSLQGFHPLKGPMATQSLRGLPNTGVLHWRGDRENLLAFNGAFVSLMGRATMLPDSEMAALSDFVMPMVYPPNPNLFLDRTLSTAPVGQASAQRGADFFHNVTVDRPRTCIDCHSLPTGTDGTVIDHLVLLESQDFKIPQLRNLYTKVGFDDRPGAVSKIGSGFTHDGATPDVFTFLHFAGFFFNGDSVTVDRTRRDLEAFVLSFDTGMAPAVGRQITFDGRSPDLRPLLETLDTLMTQAVATNCQLIAKGRIGSMPRSWLHDGFDRWIPDRAAEPPATSAQLIALAGPGRELTITGVPLGTGHRAGLDRDRDTFMDGDELAAGSDPGDPASTPENVPPPVVWQSRLEKAQPNPFKDGVDFAFTLATAQPVELTVYDLFGRRVHRIPNQSFAAGPHRLRWDGRADDGEAAASGVYFVRMNVEGASWTRTVVRVR